MLAHRSLGIIGLLASAVTGFPTLYPRQDAVGNTSIITAGVSGEIGIRQEMHTLQSDKDAWNIYLLGHQGFKNMDSTDPMSYYQIAGIHGQPYVPSNDVGPCSNCTLAGYCTHQSTLFPTWHRTYLALFKQSLIANVMAVAHGFDGADKERYLAKANILRMPYWARASAEGEDPFPQIFSAATVTVHTPSGTQNVTNSLLKYSFKDARTRASLDRTSGRPPESQRLQPAIANNFAATYGHCLIATGLRRFQHGSLAAWRGQLQPVESRGLTRQHPRLDRRADGHRASSGFQSCFLATPCNG